MKKIMTFAFCAIMMAVCSTAVQADDNQGNKQRMTREQLAEAQARHIALNLALNDDVTQKFIQAFSECQRERWALGSKSSLKKPSTTEAEAEQAIKARMEHSQKLLDIHKKYYQEYSKFLTQKQIERVYVLEKQSLSKLSKHGSKNKGKDKDKGKGKGKGKPNGPKPRPDSTKK